MKAFQAAVLPQFGRHLVEAWLQLLWGNLVQQNTDTAGAKNLLDPKQGTAVRCAIALPPMSLIQSASSAA